MDAAIVRLKGARYRPTMPRVRQARRVTSDDPPPTVEATFVHSAEGRLDVDLSLTALEAVLGPTYLRVHRSWLVSLAAVRGIARDDGEMSLLVGGSLTVPVARERAAQVKARLLSRTVGLRGNE